MSKPKFTQRMTMHLNGGNKFSALHYRVYCDGLETDITRHTRTNGSPRYVITADVLDCGEETFDIRATGGVGMAQWLQDHAPDRRTLGPIADSVIERVGGESE